MYPFIDFCHDVHNVNTYLTSTGGCFLSVLSFFSMYCLAFSFSLSLSLSLLKKRFEKDFGAVQVGCSGSIGAQKSP